MGKATKQFWIGFFMPPAIIGLLAGNIALANYLFEAGTLGWWIGQFWWGAVVLCIMSGVMFSCDGYCPPPPPRYRFRGY